MAGLHDFVDEKAEAEEEEFLAKETKDDTGFVTKDSGARLKFESGMQRDVETGKKDYSLCLGGPMFERWAALLTRGAVKYERNNWMKARGPAEEERFLRSAFRHFIQYMNGETDEDHGAAVFFNINGAEYVRGLRKTEKTFIEVTDPKKIIFQKESGVNAVPEEFEFPCTCKPGKEFHEVVDKRMAQDGTSLDPAAIRDYKTRLWNGYRYVFYFQDEKYRLNIFDAETSQLLEASSFHFLEDANQSYNRKRENDNG